MGGSNYYQGTVSALVGGSVSSISGGKFANGAVTAAMAFAFANVGQRENQESLEYVSGADAAYIDVNDARAIFDEVIEALSLTGEDTSNIVFDEGFGYSERGRTKSTTDFQRFKGARSQVPGSYNPRTGVVTIYRNAFSTTIGNIQTSPGEVGWQSFFAEAGFQS